MNPGPHGPELCVVSSTETAFKGFEFISTPWQAISDWFSNQAGPDYYMNYYMNLVWVRRVPTSFERCGLGGARRKKRG